jgi:FtsP/CotA-like multicopper oxidase with cupredoxin domain
MDDNNEQNPTSPQQPNRRTFLWLAGGGAAALAIGEIAYLIGDKSGGPTESDDENHFASKAGDFGTPDVEISLTASVGAMQVFPGSQTEVWKYTGKVLQGDPNSIQTIPGSYLGPILRFHKGQKVRIHFVNNLPESSIVHWHGLHIPSEMDGHPRSVVASGQSFPYDFEIKNRPGTYWYHPHPDNRTGPQVYHGLAGLLIIGDDQEKSLSLPSGEYDIPLVIQDRSVDANNQFVYMAGGMMESMTGFLGDRILVNGHPDFTLPVATRFYRLRLLNGSNARIYKLAWSDGTPLTVIGTDGGLLDSPVTRPYVTLAPAERIELLVDFSKYPLNTVVELRSLEFSANSGNMGMMGGSSDLPNGAPCSVFKAEVTRQETDAFVVPEKLASNTWFRAGDAINANAPRRFAISMGQMKWLLNGRSFGMDEVAENETVRLNTLEAWEFSNVAQTSGRGGGMGRMGGMGMMGGMEMPHPIHIHGVQFQVIGRSILPDFASQWKTLREGFVDEGWKDTVLVMPGETVKLLIRFEDYPGIFLYHCHILEHEDMGMMRNYRVRS